MSIEYDISTDEFVSGGNEGSPDPGRDPSAPKPLSPEEYEKLKEEAREENPPKD